MRRTLLAAAALLLLAAPLAAYTIVLKDGTRLQARQKYTVVGDKAHIVLPNGSRSVLAIADIDVAATDELNVGTSSNTTVISGSETVVQSATPPPRPPTLSQMAASRDLPELPRSAAPAATPPPETPTRGGLQRTEGGNVDLMRFARQPVTRMAAATQLGDLLRANGLEAAKIYEGTTSGRVLLDITANSEGAVFNALQVAARSLVELEAKSPGAVAAVELIMTTERRQRAGQFLLTPERARELAEKKLDATAFFMRYVEF
jgi:hypothetical protein